MKKTTSLSLLILLSIFSFGAHLVGGSMYWECLGNGKYVFHAEVYRDCSSVPLSPGRGLDPIRIFGNPLPVDASNNAVPHINITYDSTRNIDPSLCPQDSNSLCSRGVSGIERYFYRSDTVTLRGVPPSGGWSFVWEVICCMSDFTNFNGQSQYLVLRADMFPYNNQNIASCFDSSPKFVELTQPTFCIQREYTYFNPTTDADNDRVVYEWAPLTDRFLNTVSYKSGYRFDLPVRKANSKKTASLDTTNGSINFEVDTVIRSLVLIKANAYKNNVLVASVYKQIPLLFLDCNDPNIGIDTTTDLSVSSGNGLSGADTIKVKAGDSINYKIKVKSSVSGEEFFLTASGNQFASDYLSNNLCNSPPCAILDQQAFSFDSTYRHYSLVGTDSIETQLQWQTSATHLNNDSCAVYNFSFFGRTKENCGLSGNDLFTLTVVVGLDTSVCDVVSVKEELALMEQIKLYPNPTKGQFFIHSPQELQSLDIAIRNIQGQLIQRERTFGQKQLSLNIEGKAGIYFIQLTNEKGEQANFKVIKQ